MRWLRYLGGSLIIVVALFAALLLAAANVTYTAKSIGTLYAERSKLDLTAATCLKNQSCTVEEPRADSDDLANSVANKAPIGGLTEYRRCGGVVSAARVKGQPLACSEQWATDLLLRDWSNPGQSAYRQLRRGCRTHDLCYVHGRATYGHDRLGCDRELLAESLRECWMIYSSEAKANWEAERFGKKFVQQENERKPWYSRWFGFDRDEFRVACQARAAIAYLAVRAGGERLFEDNGDIACAYEGGPHAARDQVASGRFLGGDRDYVVSLSLAGKQNALIVRLLSFGPDGQSRDEADKLVISPDTVRVGDRKWTCSWRHNSDGSYRADCPEWLGPSALKSAADWLRFAPIVVDSDGDGKDELVIPSLVPEFGLVFTHIRVEREGDTVRFDPPLAHLGAARMERADPTLECEFEFADCRQTGSPPKLLSSEAADQNAGYQFTVAKSADAACPPLGNPNRQDILLISAFSDFPQHPTDDVVEKGGWDSDYVLRRFTFDRQSQRWQMRRDRFNNDWHRMAGCSIRESRDQFQTHSRLQYPPFVVRLPPVLQAKLAAENPPKCAYEERLALIARDKCPTSAPIARAGGLNDVDLMLYKPLPNKGYDFASDAEKRREFPKDGNYDELRLAEVYWKPILLPETADPAVTSRAAREKGIVMVGAYIGGTKLIGRGGNDIRRVGHHPVIAVVRAKQLLPLNEKGYDRYADTIGQVPDLYGLFKSSSFHPATTSEKASNLWDPKRYGPVSIYFQIPSVLTSFDARGGEGVSVAFFSNHALWSGPPTQEVPDWYRALASFMTGLFGMEPLSKHPSKPLPIKEGTFRTIIVPIWFKDPNTDPNKNLEPPGMFDCPVDAIAEASVPPAPGITTDSYFLRREPVLAGKFFDKDAGGSLAVAWRDVNGEIRLTVLHFADGTWKFGAKECARPGGMKKGELFRLRIN